LIRIEKLISKNVDIFARERSVLIKGGRTCGRIKNRKEFLIKKYIL
jgi:hypothetical protein